MDAFNQYFEMVPAVSDALKEEAYKLRYQVYCLEIAGYSNPKDHPDCREYDEYDRHSLHYLIRYRKSGEYAATARLILPDINFPEKAFPLEANCKIDNIDMMQQIDRANLAEASRFCISKAFKNRKNESTSLMGIDSDQCGNLSYFSFEERRTFPHLSFALVVCLIKGCQENAIDYLYGTLEPAWLRYLSSAGIHFTKIGPLADYHGLRWPGVIKISELVDTLAKENFPLWTFLMGTVLNQKNEKICTDNEWC